ncbi:hypothetical protein [Acetonema longum]|uniref:Uncharacterized protein n=1 Tax=Acetonema longum DSM 6540 TaxID=1009370 RepID=F7NDB0_9FIRM|nr:hypothetical protein [Acetonema longum]EGO65942.1 hypothetical protein ALO_00085 [Acetonema longum DSM 6540]
MVKLSVFNMKNFLQTVNECSGAVNLLHPDGKKENINKQYSLQNELLQKHREHKGCLRLSLDIQAYKDYMRIVYFTLGDC